MKNLITSLAVAMCLGTFSFTYLKDSPLGQDQRFIHTVYFWLNEDLSETDIADFENALTKLGTIPTIENYYWGPPMPTENRDVVNSSYDYAINVHFNSLQAHDTYQQHDIHIEFLKQQDKWHKVIVYDNQVK